MKSSKQTLAKKIKPKPLILSSNNKDYFNNIKYSSAIENILNRQNSSFTLTNSKEFNFKTSNTIEAQKPSINVYSNKHDIDNIDANTNKKLSNSNNNKIHDEERSFKVRNVI